MNYFVGGDPTLDTGFNLINNMTNLPDREAIWSMYTGKDNYIETRQFRRANGYIDNHIM